MTTFAKLVAAVEADPSELIRGLAVGGGEVRRFTQLVAREMKNLPTLNIVTPTHFNRLLKETAGDLDKASAAATRLNENVTKVAGSMLRMRANATRVGDVSLSRRIAALDPFQGRGFSGPQLGPALPPGGLPIPAIASPAAAAGIGRTQAAMFALMFTVGNLGEQLAAAETKWQKLDRTVGAALQTIASVAVFYGPKGLLIAGIAVVGNALSAFWTQQREEAAKLAKAFEESVARMINAGDNAALMKMAQDVWAGTPAAKFADGIASLQRQLVEKSTAILAAPRTEFGFAAAKGIAAEVGADSPQLRQLKAERGQLERLLAEKRAQFAALKQAIVDVNNTPLAIKGLPGVTAKATAPEVVTPEQAMQNLTQSAQSLVSLYKTMSDLQLEAPDVALKLVGVYDRLGAALDSMQDKWTEQAMTIRQLMTELEASPLIELMRGAGGKLPGVGVTPRAGDRGLTEPIRAAVIPDLGDIGPTIGSKIMAGLGPMIDTLKGVVGPAFASLAASMGPVALLFIALQPAFEALQPLLERLVRPLAAVAEVIILSLEPSLKILFPIIRSLAIVLAFFYEIMARVTAGIARGIGGLLVGLGNLINKLPGSPGNAIKRAGQSMLDFADEQKRNADRMAETRKRLERMSWDDTADGVRELGDAATATADALRNVPEIWKVNLARWRATIPVNVEPPAPPITPRRPRRGEEDDGEDDRRARMMAPAAEGGGLAIYGNVTIQTRAANGEQLWREFTAIARREALRTTGSTSDWARMVR